MKAVKKLVYFSVLLILVSSCAKDETFVLTRDSVIGSDKEDNIVFTDDEMREIASRAFSVYDSIGREKRVVVETLGEGDSIYSLNFVYLDEYGGYVLESAPYFAGTLTIPATVNSLPVVGIADYAFCMNRSVSSLSPLPSTIRIIGRKAFYGCSSLEGELVLPHSLEVIGEYAFSSTQLSGVLAIPSSVREIREGAFESTCFSSLMMAEGVVTIGEKAFSSMRYLHGDIYIPESVKTIASSAFDLSWALNGSNLVTESGFYRVSN